VFDIYASASSRELNARADSGLLTWNYCTSICSILEGLCGVRDGMGERIVYNNQREQRRPGTESIGEDEIFDDLSLSCTPWSPVNAVIASDATAGQSHAPQQAIGGTSKVVSSLLEASKSSALQQQHGQPHLQKLWAAAQASFEKHTQIDSKHPPAVVSAVSLAFSTVFSRLSQSLFSHVQHDLKSHDMPRVDGDMLLKVSCCLLLCVFMVFAL
jgi:hypothetical protein